MSLNKIMLAAGLEIEEGKSRERSQLSILHPQAGDDGGLEQMASVEVVSWIPDVI